MDYIDHTKGCCGAENRFSTEAIINIVTKCNRLILLDCYGHDQLLSDEMFKRCLVNTAILASSEISSVPVYKSHWIGNKESFIQL